MGWSGMSIPSAERQARRTCVNTVRQMCDTSETTTESKSRRRRHQPAHFQGNHLKELFIQTTCDMSRPAAYRRQTVSAQFYRPVTK